jgi:FAD/FMN-containing dehydrogenase
MSHDSVSNGAASKAADELRSLMQGRVLLPADDGYEAARKVWSGAIDHRPALIARCQATKDVQAAVRAAKTYGLALAVRGGGHDWAGRSVRHGGLMIDLSPMRQVKIEAATKAAIVAGGATAEDVINAAAPHELVAVTGNCGTVGMAGLTLGGGYGQLIGKHGLALDNLLAAEIVLANGQFVTADATHNSELFWALRGGGGNFGIVTAMRIRLHPMRSLLAGMIMFPWSEAELVLRGYAEVAASAPDDLTMLLCAICGPEGKPALFIAPAWCGEPTKGERIVAALQNLGNPVAAQIGPMAYADLVGMFNAHITDGRHHVMHTRWLPKLTTKAITALCARECADLAIVGDSAAPFPRRGSARACRCDRLRPDHFLVEILASWEPNPEDDGASHRLWAQNLSETLAPVALPGGYANLLGPDEREQIASAYGDNLARLQDAKRRFDPDNIFAAQPLPTGSTDVLSKNRQARAGGLAR